jgi:hypothetical protein
MPENSSEVETRVRREIKQRLGELMFGEGQFIVLSAEEFLLRLHVDDRNSSQTCERDVWWLELQFKKFNRAYLMDCKDFLKRLEEKGIVEIYSGGSDPQMSFRISRVVNDEKFWKALYECRIKDIGEVLGLGSFREEHGAQYMKRAS